MSLHHIQEILAAEAKIEADATAALRADLQATIAKLTALDKMLAEKSAALIGGNAQGALQEKNDG